MGSRMGQKLTPIDQAHSSEAIAILRELAEWFDNPNRSPLVMTRYGVPGMLLRDIASELEKTIAAKAPNADFRHGEDKS